MGKACTFVRRVRYSGSGACASYGDALFATPRWSIGKGSAVSFFSEAEIIPLYMGSMNIHLAQKTE